MAGSTQASGMCFLRFLMYLVVPWTVLFQSACGVQCGPARVKTFVVIKELNDEGKSTYYFQVRDENGKTLNGPERSGPTGQTYRIGHNLLTTRSETNVSEIVNADPSQLYFSVLPMNYRIFQFYYAVLAITVDSANTKIWGFRVKKNVQPGDANFVDLFRFHQGTESLPWGDYRNLFVFCHSDLDPQHQKYLKEIISSRYGEVISFETETQRDETVPVKCLLSKLSIPSKIQYRDLFGKAFVRRCLNKFYDCYFDPVAWQVRLRHHNSFISRVSLYGNLVTYVLRERQVFFGLAYDHNRKNNYDRVSKKVCLANLDANAILAVAPVLETSRYFDDGNATNPDISPFGGVCASPKNLITTDELIDSLVGTKHRKPLTFGCDEAKKQLNDMSFYGFIVAAGVASLLTLFFISALILVCVAAHSMKKEGKSLPKKPWETMNTEDQTTDVTMGATENTSIYGSTLTQSIMGPAK